MDRIVLVRHAEPDIDPQVAAADWGLTARGVQASRRLAVVLSGLNPGWIVTSPERKARETAALLAESLEIPVETDERLAEHGAGPNEFFADYNEFRQLVEAHFAHPDQVVFRGEASSTAAARFGNSVTDCAARLDHGMPVLVSHGRIIASWLSGMSGHPATEIWNELRMPDLIEVDLQRGTFVSHHVSLIPQE